LELISGVRNLSICYQNLTVTEKPIQLNLLNNIPQRGNGFSANVTTQPRPAFPMPYGYYPPPHSYFPNSMQWLVPGFPQPASSQAYGTPQPNPTVPLRRVRGPQILAWLPYCDCLPDCDGKDLSALTDKFCAQGY
jgi:hypothetical protein